MQLIRNMASPFILSIFISLTLASEIDMASETTCLSCTAAGNSWYPGQSMCLDGPSCPLTDVPCCTNIDCCATRGCRNPSEFYFFSWGIPQIPCTSCCTGSDDSCVRKSGNLTGGYDTIEKIGCVKDDYECPPCAMCLTEYEDDLVVRSESSIAQICTREICEDAKNNVFVTDPCSLPTNEDIPEMLLNLINPVMPPPPRPNCDCFCKETNALLESCPHIVNGFWNRVETFSIDEFCNDGIHTDAIQQAACAKACANTSCCFGDPDMDCDPRRRGVCDDYKACEILIHDKTLEHTLDEICTEEIHSNQELYFDCQNACSDVMCCFMDPELNCFPRRTGSCGNYTACEILISYDVDDVYPSDVQTVNNVCTDDIFHDRDRWAECQLLCADIMCCFWDPHLNCGPRRNEVCGDYSACEKLSLGSADDGDDDYNFSADYDDYIYENSGGYDLKVEDVCTSEIFEDDTLKRKCTSMCEDIMCCFWDPNLNCYPRKVGICEDFTACEILMDTGNKIVDVAINATVDDVCTSSIFENDRLKKKCEDMCDHIMCCFWDPDLNCYPRRAGLCGDGNYTACKILVETDNIVEDEEKYPSDVATVNEICTDDIWNNKGQWAQCRLLCADVMCCFYDENSKCEPRQNEVCDDYSACEKLAHGDPGNSTEVVVDVAINATVDDVCTSSIFENDRLKKKCKDMCDHIMCCYLDPDLNCYPRRAGLCGDGNYTACKILVETDNIVEDEEKYPSDVSTVNETCTDDIWNNKGQWAQCRLLCADVMCCFYDENSKCDPRQNEVCDDYSACEKLAYGDPSDLDGDANASTIDLNIAGVEKADGAGLAAGYIRSQGNRLISITCQTSALLLLSLFFF